jgi:hypothetical protein
MERHGLTQGLSKDYAGRWCKDFFRVAIDFERRSDWSQALPEIKRRLEKSEREILLDYHLELMEGHEGKDVDDERRILGRWSFVSSKSHVACRMLHVAFRPYGLWKS